MLTPLRSAVLALLLAFQLLLPACADASRPLGLGLNHHRGGVLGGGQIGGGIAGVTYDASIGNGVDTNGRTSLPLRVGAFRYYVNSSTGSNSNTCTQAKSASTPVATVKAAQVCVVDGEGDQILVAQGMSYPNGLDNFGVKGGFSATYPWVLESYDPADPTNEAKLGAATGSSRPVVNVFGTDSASGFIQGGPSDTARQYRAFRGLEFNPGNLADSQLNVLRGPAGGKPDYLLFENNVFAYTGVSASFGDSNLALDPSPLQVHLVLRNNAFYGTWGNTLGDHQQCVYASFTDGAIVEDNVFWHCGWNTTATRTSDPTVGGPTIFNHPIYIGVDTRNTVVRRNVFIDNDADGGILKGGGIYDYNLSINNPIGVDYEAPVGYTYFAPFGVGEEAAFNTVIGGGGINAGAMDWGIRTTNATPGSMVHHNVLVNSSAKATSAFMIDTPTDNYAISFQSTYTDFTFNVGSQWNLSGASQGIGLSGTPADHSGLHYTFANNVWDDPSSGSNLAASGVAFPNAYTLSSLTTVLGYASLSAAQTDWLAHPEQHGWRNGWSLMATGYGITSPPLGNLVSPMSLTVGVKSTGQFLNTRDGSTLSASSLPTGVTVDSTCLCWRYDGTGSATTGTATITETNPALGTHNTSLAWAAYARPVLSSLTVTPGSTTASATVSTTVGSGTLYWVASPVSNATDWSLVRVGTNYDTSASTAHGSQAISASGSQSIASITGLTASTTYYLNAAQVDANSNPAATVQSSFTTTAGGSTTQWSAANSDTHWAISGGSNNIGTYGTSSFWGVLRANNAKSSGDFTVTINAFAGLVQIGLSTSAVTTNGAPDADAHAVVYEAWSGKVSVGGSLVATYSSTWNDGDKLKVANSSGTVTFSRCAPTCTPLGAAINATSIGSSLYPIAASTSNGQVLTADFTNW